MYPSKMLNVLVEQTCIFVRKFTAKSFDPDCIHSHNNSYTFSGVYAPGPGFIATSVGTTYLVLNENAGDFDLVWLVSHESYAPGAGVT